MTYGPQRIDLQMRRRRVRQRETREEQRLTPEASATIDLYGPPRYARSTTDGRRS